jgi:hypothetical protein
MFVASSRVTYLVKGTSNCKLERFGPIFNEVWEIKVKSVNVEIAASSAKARMLEKLRKKGLIVVFSYVKKVEKV